jgi:hypothetical protein
MNLPHQLPRLRSLLVKCTAVIVVTCCGCADMLPSDETMQKWSPSNMWYRMSPNQLSRLNEGAGLPSDVYYSISDYPERDRAPVPADQKSSDVTVIKPIDGATGNARQ